MLVLILSVLFIIGFLVVRDCIRSEREENERQVQIEAERQKAIDERRRREKELEELNEYLDRAHNAEKKYEHITFRLKGVTFRNEDGSDRQKYLRDIKRRKPPFDQKLSVSIEEFEYDGKPAMSVTVNGCYVGNVPKEIVPQLIEKWDRIDCISAFDVIGGGKGKYSGESLSYGAEVVVRFFANHQD